MNTGERSLILITTLDCHLCEHAREVLGRLGREFPLRRSEIDWESPEGQSMVRADWVPLPPALYMNGHLVAYGRLSERRLQRLLAEESMP